MNKTRSEERVRLGRSNEKYVQRNRFSRKNYSVKTTTAKDQEKVKIPEYNFSPHLEGGGCRIGCKHYTVKIEFSKLGNLQLNPYLKLHFSTPPPALLEPPPVALTQIEHLNYFKLDHHHIAC